MSARPKLGLQKLEAGPYIVRFLRGFMAYSGGVRAGFDATSAAALVRTGIAVAEDAIPGLRAPATQVAEPVAVEPHPEAAVDETDLVAATKKASARAPRGRKPKIS